MSENEFNYEDTESTTGEVKQMITHDFVLDVYEQAMSEPDADKKDAIIATAEVLSKNIGTYLIDIK